MFIGELIVVISGDRCWLFVDLRILVLEFSMFFFLKYFANIIKSDF